MASGRIIKEAAKRRQAVLRYVRAYVAKNGYAPTISEIAVKVGLTSPTAARNHLLRLQEEGYLMVTPKIARAVVLADPAPDGWTVQRKAS